MECAFSGSLTCWPRYRCCYFEATVATMLPSDARVDLSTLSLWFKLQLLCVKADRAINVRNVHFQEVWRAVSTEPRQLRCCPTEWKLIYIPSHYDSNLNHLASTLTEISMSGMCIFRKFDVLLLRSHRSYTLLPYKVRVNLSSLSLWSKFQPLSIKADRDIDVWNVQFQKVWRAVTS